MAKKLYSERDKNIYKTYRKRFFQKKRDFVKRNRQLLKQGKEQRYFMRDEQPLSRYDFMIVYRDYKENLKEEGYKNPNVVQYIVSDQAYKYSRAQYLGLRKAIKNDPSLAKALKIKKLSELDFRTEALEIDWDEIKREYHYQVEFLGKSSDAAKEEVSNIYFGSE